MSHPLTNRIRVAVVAAGLASGLALLSVSEAGAATMQSNSSHSVTNWSSNSSYSDVSSEQGGSDSSDGQYRWDAQDNCWYQWNSANNRWDRSSSEPSQFPAAS